VGALQLFLDSVGDQAIGLRAKLGAPQKEVTSAGRASGGAGAYVEQEYVWVGGDSIGGGDIVLTRAATLVRVLLGCGTVLVPAEGLVMGLVLLGLIGLNELGDRCS